MSFDESYIENLKERIRNTPYDNLQENVYVCFANGCLLLTSFLQKKGEPGWASQLINEKGESILSAKEQETIETLFASAPWIWDMLSSVKQKGGAEVPQLTTATSFVKSLIPNELTGNDVSLDKMFQAFLHKTNELDDYWARFARESPGFARVLNQDEWINTEVQGIPIKFPVSRKPVVYFLIALIDSFRLSAALVGSPNYILTLIVLIEELITGQWRQMIMTSVGFISPTGVALGVIFKYLINTWLLLNPTLRDQILKDAYKGTKSLMIGFILWAASTLPPMVVKVPVEMAISKLREMAEGMEGQIKAIEEEGSKALAPLGKKLLFTDADFSKISKISLEDIQNLQTLAQWDFINCTSEFQAIVTPLSEFPPSRLLLELLGVPVTVEDKLEVCRMPEPYPSITQTVQQKLTPQVVNEKKINVKGGAYKKTLRAQKTKSKRQTRHVKVTKLT
jgi:hypothetical protein